MSAIAGLWSFDGRTEAGEACRQMLEALRIYGADGCAQYSSATLAMGRCLSRLLPEDGFDRQPLSADGCTALAADLRLDNRHELARELSLADTAAMADSEILLEAWRRWREHSVDHLLGAFSFAVWDEREQELFLARDPTGERPLYYFSSENHFAFASMPKGLHALSFVGAQVDEDYVASYLASLTIPIERTIFQRILRLPAGSTLSVRRGKTRIRRYWQFKGLAELRLRSDEEYLELFRARFDQAVAVRLRTTGGIGTHLSGGLDSSSVAATAARLLAAQGRGLTAYTAVPRPGFDARNSRNVFENEGPAAAEVAALYPNMRHVLVDSSGGSFLDAIDLSNSLYDQPCYGPTNEVWLIAILTQAREDGVTAVLNGYCGNATLSSYGMSGLSEWFRSGRWLALARASWQIKAARSASLKAIARNALGPSLPFWLRRVGDPHMRHFSLDYCMLHPEIIERLDLERRALHDLNTEEPGGRHLLSYLLEYGDVSETSIAPQAGWGLDFRDPTFDKRIVEFCLTVPLEQFLRGGQLRSLARRAMADRLPPSTLNRTQRGRQAADWYYSLSALRGKMLAEIDRLERSPLASRMLDLPRMRSLIENWPASAARRFETETSHHAALTRGFSVGKFLAKYDPEL